MGDLNTAPAEAYAPDPDLVDPDSPDLMPAWAAYLIALLILFLLEHSQAVRQRRARRLASRPARQPALPQDSAQPSAATIPSQSNDVTARTRRSRAATPEHQELPHVLQALLARLKQCEGGPSVWSQLLAMGIVPSLLDPDTAPVPAAPAPSLRRIAKIRRAHRGFAPAGPRHRVPPAPRRQMLARAGTGPPAVSRCQPSYA